MFTSCFNRANNSDDMNVKTETVEVFRNGQLKVLTKDFVYFDQLRHWKNTDIDKRRLFDLF